jgi:hypothetical protein
MADKFTNKFLSQYKKLYAAKIGFEFEFYTSHSYYKLLELLNIELKPIKTWGKKQYHSNFTPDEFNFKIEPDLSGGPNMVELITGPMEYSYARIVLIKILKFMQLNAFTDEHCSLHINISFNNSDLNISKLNPLLLILDLDEDLIYKHYPNRKSNIYARSIKNIIPFKEWDDVDAAVNIVSNSLSIPNDTKYYGVNFYKMHRGWLEYRYIGGENYHQKLDSILILLDYFIVSTYDAITQSFSEKHTEKLREYIEYNITSHRNFRTYEGFLSNFPNLELEVNTEDNFNIITSFYERFYERIFDLLHNCEEIKGGLINYNSERDKLELIGAKINGLFLTDSFEFIDCEINNANVIGTVFIDSKIKNSHLHNSKLHDSEVSSSKVSNCKALDFTVFKDCYLSDTYIDGKVEGGIIRSGKLGPNGDISKTTKLMTADNFWNSKEIGEKDKLKLK